jgi:catechol 2,3-dioxygenase-like lactoylglutathione lyase family enzyme
MRRFHVHLAVEDLAQSIAFYSKLFGEPARTEADYAKWMIEDPRVNFAISTRGNAPGVNHLGIQVESADDLLSLRSQFEAAEITGVPEIDSSCCYAKSDKYWVTDPQGIAWETYHTLGSIPTYGGDSSAACGTSGNGSSCAPESTQAPRQAAAHACCG